MPSPALPHRLPEGSLHLRPGRLVVDLGRLRILMPEELLKQVLGHSLVCQALRNRVAKQVRVDILPDLRDRSEFLDDLLGASAWSRALLEATERRIRSGDRRGGSGTRWRGSGGSERPVSCRPCHEHGPQVRRMKYPPDRAGRKRRPGFRFREASVSGDRGSHSSHKRRRGAHRAPRA